MPRPREPPATEAAARRPSLAGGARRGARPRSRDARGEPEPPAARRSGGSEEAEAEVSLESILQDLKRREGRTD